MTKDQKKLVSDLQDLFVEKLPKENVEPFLTRLAVAFEETAPALDPDLLAKIELALSNAGTMAANNIQGLEARRARAENEAPARYCPFTWKPVQGDDNARLSGLLAGLQDIALSVNEAPPGLPTE